MRRAFAILGGLAAALTAAVVLVSARDDGAEVRATIAAAEALSGGDTAGYLRAVTPRAFSFPEDHGPHPGFRTEWWYFTGNLETGGGRAFGYQLTFFRNALAPDPAERASAWGTGVAWMAHFALSDIEDAQFHNFERFAREAVGLAGARAEPWRVWVEGWRAGAATSPQAAPVTLPEPDPGRAPSPSAANRVFPVRLHAVEGDVALDLVLERGKPPVLHGEKGLSRKGPEPGNASYYYSLTRMPTVGTIRIGARAFPVRGMSWLDREWSTSALGEEQEGWDWFALQLDDGMEIMYYRLRGKDGAPGPFSAGTLVDRSGAAQTLSREDVALEVLDWWRSPADGTHYPAKWRMRVPAVGLDLVIAPAIADQELRATTVRYWEGAVAVTGSSPRGRLSGRGYAELTGYERNSSSASSRVFR